MGGVESALGNAMQRLLMPTAAPAWYAGAKRVTGFPESPEGSLLLLSEIRLHVADLAAAKQFFVEGLGATAAEAASGELVISAGACRLRLSSKTDEKLPQAWPGHFYLWVEDTVTAWKACEALQNKSGKTLIQDVHRIKDENKIDALELTDPSGQNRFVINQAPVGGFSATMLSVCGDAKAVKGVNLLGLIDLVHKVPKGTAVALARFYTQLLDAAIRLDEKKQGYSLHFSLGPALNQCLTFVDEEAVAPPAADSGATSGVPEICFYMPSLSRFRSAFNKLKEAGLVEGTLEDAEKACEFRFHRCIDPANQKQVLELRHVIRTAKHSEWHLNLKFEGNEIFTPEEVAKHNTKEDAWIILSGEVWNVTKWIPNHPGGELMIGRYLGKDATEEWKMIHKPGSLEKSMQYLVKLGKVAGAAAA